MLEEPGWLEDTQVLLPVPGWLEGVLVRSVIVVVEVTSVVPPPCRCLNPWLPAMASDPLFPPPLSFPITPLQSSLGGRWGRGWGVGG